LSSLYHNDATRDIFHQNIEKVLVLQETDKECVSVDINKAYTNSLDNNEEPWCTFDFLGEIEQCDELDGPGKYYIELDEEEASDEQKLMMQTFFKTKGWFYRNVVSLIQEYLY